MEALAEREYARRSGMSSDARRAGDDRRAGCIGALVLGSARGCASGMRPSRIARGCSPASSARALQRSSQNSALRASLAEIQQLNRRLAADNVCLKEDVKTFHDFDEIVGESRVMRDALERIAQVAPPIARSCCSARRARARNCSPGRCTSAAAADRARSSASTAPRCRPADRERAVRPREGRVHRRRRACGRGASSWPTAAPSSSTKSATCRSSCRPSCCACCRRASSSASARHARGASTCASSPRRTTTSEAAVAEGQLPRRSLLPAQRLSDPRPAAARAARGHPVAGLVLHSQPSARAGPPHHQGARPT